MKKKHKWQKIENNMYVSQCIKCSIYRASGKNFTNYFFNELDEIKMSYTNGCIENKEMAKLWYYSEINKCKK